MATLIPSSNVEAAYEDMFKEITRKLYGEETGNGLHTLGTPVAQVATTGPTAPEGERSFTNLQIDRSTAPTIEYEHNAGAGASTATTAAAAQNANVVIQQQPEGSVVVATTGGNFKSEDHLSTAFGLAALMQNGFTTTTTGTVDGSQQQTQIVQWTTPTTGGKLQSYTQQQVTTTKSKSKNRTDHAAAINTTTEVIYASPSTSSTNLNSGQTQQNTPSSSNGSGTSTTNTTGSGGNSRKKSHNNSHSNHQNGNNANNNGGVQIQKRYACTHCPYSTDRRDLYTRHENIHKDEKPFQCFACLKQFNRADHVKKHFLRMHRELQYDINKTRRHVPSSSGGNQHAGGRGNVTITAVNNSSNNSSGSPEQKPNIFQATNVQLDSAFLEGQRQPTSSSLSIAETIEAVATAADAPLPQLKQEKNDDATGVQTASGSNGGVSGGNLKPKREKRFTCCYCPWSGADKWGLKRHLNTHTKPFVCLLCDYKAARSERLATHVLKVHNKRACNKCSFLADTQEEYQAHINEVHVGNNSSTSSNAGVGGGGSVTIYTTTTTNDNGSGNITGGPLQEIIVNPTSMVGWRLSANGSLIPPHDLLTGALPNAAAQKRGSERLFQYLEADGSDPEDYARLLKMDAISRNTASVAQDFHKAGGVHELKIPANHQLLFNNKLPSQWTTKEAALLLHSLSNSASFASYQQQQRSKYSHQLRQRQHSTGEDDENTPSSASSSTSNDGLSPMKLQRTDRYHSNSNSNSRQNVAALTTSPTSTVKQEQRRAMLAFLSENFDLQETTATTTVCASEIASSNGKHKYHQPQQQYDNDEDQENQAQLIKSPPAYNKYNNNNSNQMKIKTEHQQLQRTNANNNISSREHRLDLHHANKENNNNAATFLSTIEYQNLNKIGTQIQNYVKDIINKYYAEPPIVYPAATALHQNQQMQQQQPQQQLHVSPKRKRSETEEYIEYLRNKEDITLTITPKVPAVAKASTANVAVSNTASAIPLAKRPKTNQITTTVIAPIPQQQVNGKRRKSLSQLATLLPLLADAASQQQYLAAPLDFSKKPTCSAEATATATKNATETATVPPANNATLTAASQNAAAIAAAQERHDKRSSRKQAQPKKIRAPPELVVAMLRDKYLNRMVDRKLSCRSCALDQHTAMLVFNYHTKGSLALHRLWKHQPRKQQCTLCSQTYKQRYSLNVHYRRKHTRWSNERLASRQQQKA